MALTKFKIGAAVVIAGLAAASVLQYQANGRQRGQNQALRDETAAVKDQLPAEKSSPAGILPATSPADQQDQTDELLRLRTEVAKVKKQLAETAKTRADERAAFQQAHADDAAAEESFKQAVEAMHGHMEAFFAALTTWLQQNQGQFPSSFEQVRPFVPAEEQAGFGLLAQQFEITYQGSISNLTDPADVVVIRQKQAFQTPGKGSWLKAYIFADGHSDLQAAPDGNFAPWESKHTPNPAGR